MKRAALPPMPPRKFPVAGSKKPTAPPAKPSPPRKPVDLRTPPELQTRPGRATYQAPTVEAPAITSQAPPPATPIIEELEEGLKWSSKDLTGAQEQQPTSFYRVAKRLAEITAERDSAKLYLAQIEARVAVGLRDDAERDKIKITVDEVNQRVALDPEVQLASERLLKSNGVYQQLSALKEAYIQRGYTIRDHILLQTQSGSEIDPATRLAEDNRREMANQRSSYRMPQPRS